MRVKLLKPYELTKLRKRRPDKVLAGRLIFFAKPLEEQQMGVILTDALSKPKTVAGAKFVFAIRGVCNECSLKFDAQNILEVQADYLQRVPVVNPFDRPLGHFIAALCNVVQGDWTQLYPLLEVKLLSGSLFTHLNDTGILTSKPPRDFEVLVACYSVELQASDFTTGQVPTMFLATQDEQSGRGRLVRRMRKRTRRGPPQIIFNNL